MFATLWPVNGVCFPLTQQFITNTGRLMYSRSVLMELGHLPVSANEFTFIDDIPRQILCNHKQNRIQRKRGSTGGIINRIKRRGSRLPLSAIALSIARSLRNKTEELSILLKLWATNYTVRESESRKHYERMTSFRPHYLPREFSQLTNSKHMSRDQILTWQ